MGVTKTQDRARSTFFWVGISKEIESVIGNCEVCQKYAKRQPKECQGQVQDISEAWESTATDLFEFKGNTYLIISCRFSGYMAIRDMKDHSAEETIKQCQSIFRELGVPKTLLCDRGSNYTSVQFQEFAKSINMNLTYGSSEHHSSNYAERSIQTVKNFMRKSKEWSICLLEYHMTPIRHQGAESSPIRLMQHRTIRGILPTRQQETNQCNYEKFRTRKLEQSQYQTGQNLPTLPIGSSVLYYSAVRNQWSPGVIVERVHDRSYTVISQKGRMLSRNRVDLKPYHKEVTISFEPPKSLFSGKSLVSCSPRTARLLLKIVDKDIRFFYQNGPTMHISDALSRLPTHNTNTGNQQEVQGLKVSISEISPVQTNVSLNQFKEHTSKDQVMQQMLEYVMKGWPRMQKTV